MNDKKAAAQSQGSQRQSSDLDNRYGKIGISAVAAAVRQQREQNNDTQIRSILYDRD